MAVLGAAGPGPGPGDELVQDVIPYRRRSRLLWGTVLPFCGLYPLWVWFWGPSAWAWAWGGPAGAETPEAALLYLAAVGAIHLLTALAGLWSVNVHCFLYCCWVSRAPVAVGEGHQPPPPLLWRLSRQPWTRWSEAGEAFPG